MNVGDWKAVGGNRNENLLLQNDVIALIDDAGETVVEYKYSSWGKICQR